MLNDVIGGILGIERVKWNISRISVAFLVCMVKMVCFARVGKEVCQIWRFPCWTMSLEEYYGSNAWNGTCRGFCRIPSLHGENGMFCKSGKRSLSDLKISMLNDVIGGVLRIERMKWNISRISVAFLVCMVKMVCFARVGKEVCQIWRFPCETMSLEEYYGSNAWNGTFRGFLSHS